MGTQNEIEALEKDLLEGLPQLYDPTYRPPDLLYNVTGAGADEGVEAIRAVLTRTIEALKPSPETPPTARVRRLYDLLAYRYIRGLTQVQTAQRLGLTVRHLRREQKQAIHLLAQRLLAQRPLRPLSVTLLANAPDPLSQPEQTAAWRTQVRQELAALQQNAPGMVAEVGAVIRDAVKSGQVLGAKHSVDLRVEPQPPDLLALIHPAVLREVLMTAIKKLVEHMETGEIVLRAEPEKDQLKITLAGYPTTAQTPPTSDFIREALGAPGGSMRTYLEEDTVFILIMLPAAHEKIVAVVEDNPDLIRLYQTFVARTRYQILPVTDTARTLEILLQRPPDVIVMDIMLPDINGWELLTQLRVHPATQSIPVIICSVVRQEELGLAHGARLYLPKPVRRQEFVQSLDQVLNPAPAAAPKVAMSRPVTY